jgi:hypothetical protein
MSKARHYTFTETSMSQLPSKLSALLQTPKNSTSTAKSSASQSTLSQETGHRHCHTPHRRSIYQSFPHWLGDTLMTSRKSSLDTTIQHGQKQTTQYLTTPSLRLRIRLQCWRAHLPWALHRNGQRNNTYNMDAGWLSLRHLSMAEHDLPWLLPRNRRSNSIQLHLHTPKTRPREVLRLHDLSRQQRSRRKLGSRRRRHEITTRHPQLRPHRPSPISDHLEINRQSRRRAIPRQSARAIK